MNRTTTAALLTTGLALAASVAVGTPAHATTPCRATVSIAHPRDGQTEVLTVHTTRSAKTTATLHYKTKNTVKSVAAGATGVATIRFEISRATYGYRVAVAVATSSRESCSTAFTPER